MGGVEDEPLGLGGVCVDSIGGVWLGIMAVVEKVVRCDM